MIPIRKRKSHAMATIAFRISKEDAKQIKQTAKRAKCTPSELLRNAWQAFVVNAIQGA